MAKNEKFNKVESPFIPKETSENTTPVVVQNEAGPTEAASDIDIFDDLFVDDSSEVTTASSEQDAAYDTYKENIAYSQKKEAWQSVRDNSVEIAKITDEKPLATKKNIGSQALRPFIPYATELIQRHNSHKKMRIQYLSDAKRDNAQRRQNTTSAFHAAIANNRSIRSDQASNKEKENQVAIPKHNIERSKNSIERERKKELIKQRRVNIRKAIGASAMYWRTKARN